MRWLLSMMGRRNSLGMWQRMMSNLGIRMGMRNNRTTALSLIALAVGATAYGMRRRMNRNV